MLRNLLRPIVATAVAVAFAVNQVQAAPINHRASQPDVASTAPVRHNHRVQYEIIADPLHVATRPGGGQGAGVYQLQPSIYVATVGDQVNLNIREMDGHIEDVAVDAYGVHSTRRSRDTVALNFRADKPGIFRIVGRESIQGRKRVSPEGFLVVVPKDTSNPA